MFLLSISARVVLTFERLARYRSASCFDDTGLVCVSKYSDSFAYIFILNGDLFCG